MARLTPEANRAARAILRWSVRDLAGEADVAFSTVHRFESTGSANGATLAKMEAAFARHHVEIIDDHGTGARLIRRTPDEGLRPEELNSTNDD